MAYRGNVQVVVLSEDATTGEMIPNERKDMNFTVLADEPGDFLRKAKEQFKRKHGPDMVVRTANLQSRKQILLYCMPQSAVRNVMKMSDIGNLVKQMPTQRR